MLRFRLSSREMRLLMWTRVIHLIVVCGYTFANLSSKSFRTKPIGVLNITRWSNCTAVSWIISVVMQFNIFSMTNQTLVRLKLSRGRPHLIRLYAILTIIFLLSVSLNLINERCVLMDILRVYPALSRRRSSCRTTLTCQIIIAVL